MGGPASLAGQPPSTPPPNSLAGTVAARSVLGVGRKRLSARSCVEEIAFWAKWISESEDMGRRGNSVWSWVEKGGCIQCRSNNLASNYSGYIVLLLTLWFIFCNYKLQLTILGFFCMHDSNQSNGLTFVESDGIGNYLGHPYSKEQSTGKEGTKPFWLSLEQCNPFYK